MRKLFGPVLYVCGVLALIMAGLMLIVELYALATNDQEQYAFILSTLLTTATGVVMILLFKPEKFQLTTRQLYLLTSCCWLMLSMAGALPLTFSHYHFHLVDAFFESASGITTTGSTILHGLSEMPHSLLLWRSMLQWIGGLGFIGMAVSILPFLRVGGMRLFQTESSDWADKSLPRLQEFTRSLVLIYLAITVLCSASYWACGMGVFDAINHGMTTVSTGGYATDDRSMGRFDAPILWVCIVFMLIGGLPFTLLVRLVMQPRLASLKDEQARGFLIAVLALSLLLASYLALTQNLSPWESLTQAAFNVTSVITTTGYASADYTLWGSFSIALFFFLTFVGGCSGSTSGGMKIFRFQLSYLFLKEQLSRLIHPRGVFTIDYNGKPVRGDILASAVAFSFLFFMTLGLVTLLLCLVGLDFVTALTGAATALSNVGPGLGDIIGPAGNFATLPDSAKWVLSVSMILGRLELLTLMVVLTPAFWRA